MYQNMLRGQVQPAGKVSMKGGGHPCYRGQRLKSPSCADEATPAVSSGSQCDVGCVYVCLCVRSPRSDRCWGSVQGTPALRASYRQWAGTSGGSGRTGGGASVSASRWRWPRHPAGALRVGAGGGHATRKGTSQRPPSYCQVLQAGAVLRGVRGQGASAPSSGLTSVATSVFSRSVAASRPRLMSPPARASATLSHVQTLAVAPAMLLCSSACVLARLPARQGVGRGHAEGGKGVIV